MSGVLEWMRKSHEEASGIACLSEFIKASSCFCSRSNPSLFEKIDCCNTSSSKVKRLYSANPVLGNSFSKASKETLPLCSSLSFGCPRNPAIDSSSLSVNPFTLTAPPTLPSDRYFSLKRENSFKNPGSFLNT